MVRSAADVPLGRDLRLAVVLSAVFGVFGAVAAALMMEALPVEARELPLPLPVFCVVLAVQLTIVYGLAALGGLRLGRARGLDPVFGAAGGVGGGLYVVRAQAVLVGAGLLCGVMLVGAIALIQRFAPETLPPLLHPPTMWAALSASVAASIGEEILFRLLLLSLMLRLLPRRGWGVVAAVVVSALAFSAAHTPGFIYLYGGFGDVPAMTWVWVMGLNGVLGVVFGMAYLRGGIAGAMAAHFATDLVWHVVSPGVLG